MSKKGVENPLRNDEKPIINDAEIISGFMVLLRTVVKKPKTKGGGGWEGCAGEVKDLFILIHFFVTE